MSDKNFEEKLKKHWREEADSIPVPDSYKNRRNDR